MTAEAIAELDAAGETTATVTTAEPRTKRPRKASEPIALGNERSLTLRVPHLLHCILTLLAPHLLHCTLTLSATPTTL